MCERTRTLKCRIYLTLNARWLIAFLDLMCVCVCESMSITYVVPVRAHIHYVQRVLENITYIKHKLVILKITSNILKVCKDNRTSPKSMQNSLVQSHSVILWSSSRAAVSGLLIAVWQFEVCKCTWSWTAKILECAVGVRVLARANTLNWNEGVLFASPVSGDHACAVSCLIRNSFLCVRVSAGYLAAPRHHATVNMKWL